VFRTGSEVCPSSDGDKGVALDIVIPKIINVCMKRATCMSEFCKRVSSSKVWGKEERGYRRRLSIEFFERRYADITWLQYFINNS